MIKIVERRKKVGKIFNALEKYKKERELVTRPEKLKPADYNALQHYDRATGKLDLKHPLVMQDPGSVDRLMTYRLIEADGSLTPAGKAKYAELNGPGPKKEVRATVSVPEKEISNSQPEPKTEEVQIRKEPENKREPAAPAAPEAVIAKKEIPAVKTPAPKPSLPLSHNKRMDPDLVSFFNPQSFEAEQFKILRSNLLYPASGTPPRSVMVTSPMPGEGKSFVASNLAISAALNINRHVLLMDCDLRRPSIHTRFGFENVPGLCDYLSNGNSLSDLLIRTSIDKLTILPGGRPPDNPSELLSSERMEELLKETAARYHDRLIIVDSPPPLLTAETNVLAKWVEGVVIVIQHGKTPRESVSDIINKMGRDKITGIIMNAFEAHSSRYYGKYKGKNKIYKYAKKAEI
jgi:exopolysaccharide/PEP-CTERM locus tyrosine autokinase